jgi:hypothetical protein
MSFGGSGEECEEVVFLLSACFNHGEQGFYKAAVVGARLRPP